MAKPGRNLDRVFNGLAITLTALYPLAVYFGLQVAQPRMLAALLLAVILLRHWQSAHRFAVGFQWPEWLAFLALCGLALAIMATNQSGLLLLYPVAVSLAMLFVFGRTLMRPPSMIERFARLAEPALPMEGVRYTRKVTIAWCGFFALNACAALATVFMTREAWALYNGFISYVLMGLVFLMEWLVRARVRARQARVKHETASVSNDC
jgi:uncharacterized membrane protein